MSLNKETLDIILENTEKHFVCLRCGECCYQWAVFLPDGTKKPENHKCPYLENISHDNNCWKESSCKIYKNRPDVCQKFKISFATFCPIGFWKWLRIKNENPEIKLPERIDRIIQFINELQ